MALQFLPRTSRLTTLRRSLKRQSFSVIPWVEFYSEGSSVTASHLKNMLQKLSSAEEDNLFRKLMRLFLIVLITKKEQEK